MTFRIEETLEELQKQIEVVDLKCIKNKAWLKDKGKVKTNTS